MLLTCPTCRSGLEVPDGTTAMVRCPACKTVFSAADSPPPDPEPEVEEAPRPSRRRTRDDEDEDDKPRRKPARSSAKDKPEKDENRDFDPVDPDEEKKHKRRRRRIDDEKLSPEEKAALRATFNRGALGCKFIWGSFGSFILSMMCVIAFWFQTAFSAPNPGFVMAAGGIGLVGWILGAVGVGLCLSGPQSPGHWGYGISAAVAVSVHLLLLLLVASKGKDYSPGLVADPTGPAANWGLVPTRLDAVTFYLTVIVYKDQELVKGKMNLSIVVGIAELIRTTLILMFLSCLARATGDEELSHQCTRASGYASFGPGFMAAGMLAFTVLLTETRAGTGSMSQILISTLIMGTYAIINGCMFPGFMVARECAEACDEPFQSHLGKTV